MLLLVGVYEQEIFPISESLSIGIGIASILAIVALGVGILVMNGSLTSKYDYLEKEIFETEYGVSGMVRDRKDKYMPEYIKRLVLGIGLCILSAIPLILFSLMAEDNVFIILLDLDLTLLVVAFGVFLIVSASIMWSAFNQLLQEEDYSVKNKVSSKVTDPIMSIYWILITTIYLAYSFITNDWGRSWIIWPVAAVFSTIIAIIIDLVKNTDN